MTYLDVLDALTVEQNVDLVKFVARGRTVVGGVTERLEWGADLGGLHNGEIEQKDTRIEALRNVLGELRQQVRCRSFDLAGDLEVIAMVDEVEQLVRRPFACSRCGHGFPPLVAHDAAKYRGLRPTAARGSAAPGCVLLPYPSRSSARVTMSRVRVTPLGQARSKSATSSLKPSDLSAASSRAMSGNR